MVAHGLFSHKNRPTEVVSQSLRNVRPPSSRPIFNSMIVLALPKMENFGDDEFGNRSYSENIEAGSGNDQNAPVNRSSKRKKYHRHSVKQIQELEAAFKENPHPDEKARLDLGRRLGLESRQIKFWFQNRRTQVKTQVGRHENSILKQENDKLHLENAAMKEVIKNPICNNCGGQAIIGEVPIEEHHLLVENARLQDELNRLGILASGRINGTIPNEVKNKSSLNLSMGRNRSRSQEPTLPVSLDFGDTVPNVVRKNGPDMGLMGVHAMFDKSLLVEFAFAAMDELVKLVHLDGPLWYKSSGVIGESLNIDEYVKLFPSCTSVKPNHFVSEGSKATETVMIESVALVETLMDPDRWIQMFPLNIGRALTLDVISAGMGGNKNGAMQLMQAEFQINSPMVPVRQAKFVRFCKQHAEDIWAVVDVSVDTVLDGLAGNSTSVNCRKFPSGCIVQDLLNGYSKVTWVEHMEYDENVVHHLYRPLLKSGMAFGAQKWVSDLQRQCELFPFIMSMASRGDNSRFGPIGKKSIAELAQRMARSFCNGVCATNYKWEMLQISDDTKLMIRPSTVNSGEPPGVILSATTTVWMPISPHRLFEFLQNEKLRVHWDILSQDGPMQKLLHIPKSQDLGNGISLLHTSVLATDANPSNVLILQDTRYDASGSIIVYSAVNNELTNAVLSGEDSTNVTILPSGFAIVPDRLPSPVGAENREAGPSQDGLVGSLLTAGFQILANSGPTTKITMESVETVKSLIAHTIQGIKAGLQCN